MYLVVGLGNPGTKYQNTWHNLGAMTVELLARRWGCSMRHSKGEFLSADKLWGESRVTLMLPTSFMNRSGLPVTGYMRYYNIPPENVIVIYDDHDLPLGKIRIRADGTSGGHRGMDDIIRHSGGVKTIPRIKIGIRNELEADDLADQVLSPIPKALIPRVDQIIMLAADGVEMILKDGILAAMERVNGLNISL